MPVDAKLLEILRCPVTKQHVRPMSAAELGRLNDRIAAGSVVHVDGSPVEQPLEDALVTENGNTVYKVEDDIPIMLEELSIAMDTLGDAVSP